MRRKLSQCDYLIHYSSILILRRTRSGHHGRQITADARLVAATRKNSTMDLTEGLMWFLGKRISQKE